MFVQLNVRAEMHNVFRGELKLPSIVEKGAWSIPPWLFHLLRSLPPWLVSAPSLRRHGTDHMFYFMLVCIVDA